MKSIAIIAATVTMFATPVCTEHALRSKIDDQICRRAANYIQPPGVAYAPGVDVNGKPVVEADLNKPMTVSPERISAAITVDLGRYLGLSSSKLNDTLEGDAIIGDIVYENGAFTFNDQPLEGESASALRKLCATEKVPPKPVQNNHNEH